MIRVMLDTDILDKLTSHVELLATYADLVPDLAELAKKYPHSHVILIDRGLGDPQDLASVMDVERGAYNVSHIPEWLDRKERKGVEFRTLYVNRGNLAAADQAAAGRSSYRWVATLDGTAHIEGFAPLEGPAAVQVIGADQLGYHADLSLVFDSGWNLPRTPKWLHDARELASSLAVIAADVSHDTAILRDLIHLAR